MTITNTSSRLNTQLPYFFYGTLLDPDVQQVVLGRHLRVSALTPGIARGFRRVFVKDAWYPTLAEQSGHEVNGYVVHGLTKKEKDKIDWFEDDDYVLGAVEVSTSRYGSVRALAYMPPGPSVLTDRAWTLEEWRRRFKRQYLARSKRWMVSNFDSGW